MGLRGATMADTLGKSRRSPAAQAAAARAGRRPMRFSGEADQENDLKRRAEALRARRSSQAGVLLAFAVPVIAVGLRLLLDKWDVARPDTRRAEFQDRRQAARSSARPRLSSGIDAVLDRSKLFLSRLHIVAVAAQVGHSLVPRMQRLNPVSPPRGFGGKALSTMQNWRAHRTRPTCRNLSFLEVQSAAGLSMNRVLLIGAVSLLLAGCQSATGPFASVATRDAQPARLLGQPQAASSAAPSGPAPVSWGDRRGHRSRRRCRAYSDLPTRLCGGYPGRGHEVGLGRADSPPIAI